MPRSVFLGRVVEAGEPLWLEEDRAWALALAQVEADQCPDCHQPWSESSSPAAEGTYETEVLRCHACAAGAAKLGAFQDGNGDTRGIHVSITKSG